MGRVGYTCIVRTCNNITSITNKDIKFHSIPKDEEMCMIWLKNCDRMDLSGKSPLTLNKSYRVCGSHFEPKMYFTNRLLLHSAVPTIFTVATSSPIVTTSNTESNTLCSPPIVARRLDYPVSSSTPIMLPKNNNSMSDSLDLGNLMSYVNSTIMPWCVINGCRNSTKGTKQVGKNVSYHIIPKNPQRRSAWINILNQSSKFNANLHSSYVCSEHFVSDDYECHYLKEKLLNIKVKKQLKKTAIPSVNLPRSTGKELLNTPIFVLDSQNITNETNNICNKLQFPVKVLKLDAVPTSNFENEIIDVTSIKDIERKKVVDKMIADYDEQKNIGSPLTGIINKYPNFFSPKINSDAKLGDKLKYLQAINNMETCSPPKKQKRTKSTKSNVQSLKQPIFNNTTPNRDQFIQVSAVKGGLMLHALPLETDELKNTLPRQHGIDNDKEDETEEIIIVTKDEALDEANHADLTSYKEQHKENNTEVVIVTNLKETEDTTKHIDSLSKESSSQVCNSNNKCFEQSTLDNNESQFTPLYTAKVSLSAEKGCQISVPCKDCQDKSLKINKLIREKTKTNQICIWRDSDMNTVKRMNGVLSLLLMQCVGEKNQLIGKKSSIGINLLQEVIKRVDHGWSTQDTFETLSQALSVNAYDEFARTFNA